jgi:hypothetical protein
MAVINSILNLININRLEQIEEFRRYPHKVQNRELSELLNLARNTEYGKKYKFSEIKNYQTYMLFTSTSFLKPKYLPENPLPWAEVTRLVT